MPLFRIVTRTEVEPRRYYITHTQHVTAAQAIEAAQEFIRQWYEEGGVLDSRDGTGIEAMHVADHFPPDDAQDA